MTHHLKIYREYFQAVIDGKKPFEIRKNDRGFKVGDKVILNEYIGNKEFTTCPDIDICRRNADEETGGWDCPLTNKREACSSYTKEIYSGRRCLVRIKDIFELDKIGFENYVAFTFDILNIQGEKAVSQ